VFTQWDQFIETLSPGTLIYHPY